MSFAFKIDKALKANLSKICRLCGIDREEKITILDGVNLNDNQPVDCDGELKLHEKIIQCIGITVGKDDKMPQSACSLCVDKINDFYEFREMCYATDIQTRKLLGLKRETQKKNTINVKPIVDVKPVVVDIKEEAAAQKRGRKRKADDAVPKLVGPKVGMPKVGIPKIGFPKICLTKVVIPKVDPGPEIKSEVISQPSSNKKPRLADPPAAPMVETKKKGKLGKQQIDKTKTNQVDKNVKPKEEIKEEPAEVEKPSTAPTEKTTKFKQVCNICSQRFASKLKMEQHVAATHLPHIPRYVCTACNEIIKKTNDIKSHQLWHKLSKTPYVCGHCGQSLISSYAYSRHLRDHTVDIPPNLWVLDRECPQCHHTFLTNFLYNTHICAVKTKKCAGCNRQLRNEVEYQRHAAHCNKVYLNYSKHIPAAAAAAESSIRIKNENDVEAAAAEALARNAGITLDMTPVVSLTRISTPEILAATQGLITDFNTESTSTVQVDEPKTPGKKGSKKGVSRKDLKRVDNLLKSTLDALVSIKHEPEMHVGADSVETATVPSTSTETTAQAAHTEPSTAENADKEVEDSAAAADDDSFRHVDDFHHGDDDDSNDGDNIDASAIVEATLSTPTKDKAIKQEPVEEIHAQGAINIKQEIIDLDDYDDSVPAAKMPVLKLKIKKEHGMLNSSIVDEQSARAEKKKKKKKRKDADRNKDKASDGDDQQREITAVQNEQVEAGDDTMPNPNIVVAIKQEKVDENEHAAESHRAGSSEPTVMITIPIPQFQISAVSSGVAFDDNIEESHAEQADNETTDDAAVSTAMTTDELEFEDVKPNKAELDRLFQITSISSGVQMDAENDNHLAEEEEAAEESAPMSSSSTSQPELEEPMSNIAQKKLTKSTPKVVRHKPPVEQKTRRVAKAFKSTSGVSKPNTNNTSVSETATISFGQIQIKPEPVDRGYEAVFNAYEAATTLPETQPLDTTTEELSIREIAEHEYLKNIDFSNIQIKQEKDLDVSDVEITNTHIVANAIPNGMNISNGEETQYSENEEDHDEETDDDEEDDDDDDDWDGVKVEEEEKREYRELELPPLLTEEFDATENKKSDEVIEAEEKTVVREGLCSEMDNANSEQPSTCNAFETSTAQDHSLSANNANIMSLTEANNVTPLINEPTTSTAYTDDTLKSNATETASIPPPLPFIISDIYSQADNIMTQQLPEVMDTDVNMTETQYTDTAIHAPADTPMELQTLKISSVFAGCAATFDELLPNQTQSQQEMSTHLTTDNLATPLLSGDNAMEIGGEATNVGISHEPTGLLQDDTETFKNISDMEMDTTPATQTICMEMNVDKDALLEAQPFTDHHHSGGSAIDTTTNDATHTNENVSLGFSIQNVVGGIAHAMSESVVEEAQNLLNHEVVEAQASQQQQQLTFGNTTTSQFGGVHTQELTPQNVEETENLMNEGVAEALLLQQQHQLQQQQHTDIQISNISSAGSDVISMLMPHNEPDATKNSSSNSTNENTNYSSSSSLGRTSQSSVLNNPFLIDDSNINEIAENNNNANIERELQDDVAAAAVAPTNPNPAPATINVESNNEQDNTEVHTTAYLTHTNTHDVT